MVYNKVKPTGVSKYNAAVSTICMAVLFKGVLILNGLSSDMSAFKEWQRSMEAKDNLVNSKADAIKTDLAQLAGTITADGNRITRIEAILPKKDQFNIK